MPGLTRRDFLVQTAAAAGAAAVARTAAFAAAPADAVRGTDLVTLGRTGIQTSRLGIGTGTHGVGRSSNQQKLGQDGFTRLVRHAVERGIRYFDTGDQYGVHIFLREALKGLPRDDLFIQTKTHAEHPEVARADIERFRVELGAETLDCVLLHCRTTPTWPADMLPVMDVLSDAKQKGRVRSVGVSVHGWEPLVAAVGCDWVDVQLARINPFGTAMDGAPGDVAAQLAKMHDAGRGVIGMKICGGGNHTSREDRLKSLRHVLGLGCVDCFTIGFESIEQLDEMLAMIEQASASA